MLQPTKDSRRASASTTSTPTTCAGSCTASGSSRRRCAPGQRHQAPKSRYYSTRTPGSPCSATAGTPTASCGRRCGRSPVVDARPAGHDAAAALRLLRPALGRRLRRRPGQRAQAIAVHDHAAPSRTASSRPTPWPAKACAERPARTRSDSHDPQAACSRRRCLAALAAALPRRWPHGRRRSATRWQRPGADACAQPRARRCCWRAAQAGAAHRRGRRARHRALSDDARRAAGARRRRPVSVTLTAVRFADATHGWAVGHGGVVLATADGGAAAGRCSSTAAASPQLALDSRAGTAATPRRSKDGRAAGRRRPGQAAARPAACVDAQRAARRRRLRPGACHATTAARPGRRWMDRLRQPQGAAPVRRAPRAATPRCSPASRACCCAPTTPAQSFQAPGHRPTRAAGSRPNCRADGEIVARRPARQRLALDRRRRAAGRSSASPCRSRSPASVARADGSAAARQPGRPGARALQDGALRAAARASRCRR